MDILTVLKANLRYKKGALISIAVLMMIVTTALTGVISVNESIRGNLKAAVKALDYGDILFILEDTYATEELYEAIESEKNVERIRDVKAIMSTNCLINGTKSTNRTSFIAFDNSLDQFYLYNKKENGFVKKIEPPKAGEIYVPISFKPLYQCRLGSKIVIKTQEEVITFRIKGFIEEPFLGGYFIGVKQAFIAPEDYDKLYRLRSDFKKDTDVILMESHLLHIYQKSGTDTENKISIGEFKRELNKNTGIGDYGISLTQKDAMGYTLIFNNIGEGILYVFIVLLFIIVLIVMGHSVSTGIELDYVNLGILKSQGFTSRKIELMFLFQYLIAESAGAIIGIFLAIPFIKVLGAIFQPITGILTAPNISLIKCLLIISGILLVESVFLLSKTKRIGKISPVRAISGGIDSIYFDSRLKVPIGEKGLSLKLAFRQFTSNKRQYTGTILIVSILSYFMISMSVLANCMQSENVQEVFGQVVYDVGITFNKSFKEEHIKEIESAVEQVAAIDNTLYADYKYIAIDGDEFNCTIYDKPDRFKSILKGRAPLYKNEIIITEILSDELGKGIGDTVTLSYRGNKGEYFIAGLYQSMMDVGRCFAMSLEAERQLTDEEPTDGYIVLKDKEKAEEVVNALNKRFPDLLKAEKPEDNSSLQNIIQIALNSIAFAIYTISVLFILVVVNMVCSKIFIKEKKDIGIYKALGFSVRSLRIQFALRFLLVSVIGAVLGGIICLLFNDAMLSVLLKAVGITNFETEYTPITLLLPITVICTCFFVFSYLSSGKVKRVEVRELITE
jgi:putative ABC transport system permease protein